MDMLLSIVQKINFYLSDYILIALLVGTGLFFTIKTRFVQVRCFGEGMKNVFGGMFSKDKNKGGISSFQALATAIAAQVGTGNIVGACGAILVGGPGAIFWMWIIAFFGMATIYAEAVLAQETRETQADGTVVGGPIFYIKKAFPGKFGKAIALFFSFATFLALGFMGAMVQSNSISASCYTAFGIPNWVVGLIVAAASGLIFLGGVKRIASVTEKLVPIMAILYLIGGVVILVMRAKYLPETFGMIFKYAFRPDALIGGGIGYALKTAISQGVKRGLFSNEAGMGSTPHAHAQANVKTAHEQGCTAMFGVFLDTFVVLTMTALIVITTLYANGGANSDLWTTVNKTNAVATGFAIAFGGGDVVATIGNVFVAICLAFFAFSTILSWNLFGKINFQYLFKGKGTIIYTVIALVFVVLGSVFQNDLVWELTDFFNYLMVIPNVIALIALSKVVTNEVKDADDIRSGKKLLNNN